MKPSSATDLREAFIWVSGGWHAATLFILAGTIPLKEQISNLMNLPLKTEG